MKLNSWLRRSKDLQARTFDRWQRLNPVIAALIQAALITPFVFWLTHMATAKRVLPLILDPKQVPHCTSDFCEKSSEIINSTGNFLAVLSLSIIGAFIYLLKMKPTTSHWLRMAISIAGISFAVAAIYIFYILSIEISEQLYLGLIQLNIVNDRLAWEAGFLFLAALLLIFVFLTTEWGSGENADRS